MQVYFSLCCSLIASAFGAFLHLLLNIGGILTFFATLVCFYRQLTTPVYSIILILTFYQSWYLIYWSSCHSKTSCNPLTFLENKILTINDVFPSPWSHPWTSYRLSHRCSPRVRWLLLSFILQFTTLNLLHVHVSWFIFLVKICSILVSAFMATAIIFACFSGVAMLARRRVFIYLGGFLSSCFSILVWVVFVALIFDENVALFNIEVKSLTTLVSFFFVSFYESFSNY